MPHKGKLGAYRLVKFTDDAFGAKLIEAITAGLYDGNLNCLREYIQNSIDSKAEKIDVFFENSKTNLIIEDVGCGMNKEELTESLHLGKSNKTGSAIGWRGIGIWSGVPTCRKIVIITKKQKHPKLRVEIDADKLRQQYTLNIPATKVLTEVTGDIEELELGTDESITDSHFTIVRLEGILPNQRSIFKEENIREYLSRTISVTFNTKKFTAGKEITKKLLENGVELKEVPVYLEKEQVFRPPDSDDPFFDNIIEKQFVINGLTVAYAWVLSSKSNRALAPPNRGIYFKKKGVTIGDELLVSRLSEDTYNQWQYGEIHILTDSLKENASRNNFEANNDLLEPFYKQVGEFVSQLQSMNRYQSGCIATNTIERLKKQVDVEDVKPMREKVTKTKMRLKQNRSFPKDSALAQMKTSIDQVSLENTKALKEVEEKVENKSKEQKIDPVKEKRDKFLEFIKTAHPSLRSHLSKTTLTGKIELNIDAMEPVKTLLQKKTGLTLDTIHLLSQKAYDWDKVQRGDGNPFLNLCDPYRDRHFGVLIYALHDLFVNEAKHGKGTETFSFFEAMTEEEKIQTVMEFHMAQDLVLTLIEKSTPSKKGS